MGWFQKIGDLESIPCGEPWFVGWKWNGKCNFQSQIKRNGFGAGNVVVIFLLHFPVWHSATKPCRSLDLHYTSSMTRNDSNPDSLQSESTQPYWTYLRPSAPSLFERGASPDFGSLIHPRWELEPERAPVSRRLSLPTSLSGSEYYHSNSSIHDTNTCIQVQEIKTGIRLRDFAAKLLTWAGSKYRAGLKGSSQVVWIRGEKFASSCPQKVNKTQLFHQISHNLGRAL